MSVEDGECWKAIPEFDGYEASHLGNIRSWRKSGGGLLDAPVLIKPRVSGGYLRVWLRSGRLDPKPMLVHRLVLLAFRGPPPPGQPQTHHINHVKGDNRAANLVWSSSAENTRLSNSKIPQEQESDIEARILAGESPAAISRAYGGGKLLYNRIYRRKARMTKQSQVVKHKQDEVACLKQEIRRLR
jgi:hypothetical protein